MPRDEVAEALRVPERQRGQVVGCVSPGGLGPVEHTGDLVAVQEHPAHPQRRALVVRDDHLDLVHPVIIVAIREAGEHR